ncbi:MAG: arsenate reductase ArsC [Alphaproteobacteria bacterium]
MTTKTYNVLFLCRGNSARSLMAEALLRKLGRGRFNAYSAGASPRGFIHPLAEAVLIGDGLFDGGLRSKSWKELATADAPVFDFVFTLCDQTAGEICPHLPGLPITSHWGIPDPAEVTGSDAEQMLAFREAMRMLERWLRIFTALPIGSLDRMALQQRLDAIGRLRPDAAEDVAS